MKWPRIRFVCKTHGTHKRHRMQCTKKSSSSFFLCACLLVCLLDCQGSSICHELFQQDRVAHFSSRILRPRAWSTASSNKHARDRFAHGGEIPDLRGNVSTTKRTTVLSCSIQSRRALISECSTTYLFVLSRPSHQHHRQTQRWFGLSLLILLVHRFLVNARDPFDVLHLSALVRSPTPRRKSLLWYFPTIAHAGKGPSAHRKKTKKARVDMLDLVFVHF